jgi:Tfp pilus assembly protein PilO
MTFDTLTPSEKRLGALLGVILAVVLNLVVARFFVTNYRKISDQGREKISQRDTLMNLAQSADLWEKRAAWLQKKQPKVESESAAGTALLSQVKTLATSTQVTLSKAQPGVARTDAMGITAIPVQFTLKGTWKNVCEFCMQLQAPEKFIVFQDVRLRVDAQDYTQLEGDFTVAKWFAAK